MTLHGNSVASKTIRIHRTRDAVSRTEKIRGTWAKEKWHRGKSDGKANKGKLQPRPPVMGPGVNGNEKIS